MHEVPKNLFYNLELQVNNQDMKKAKYILGNKTFTFHDMNYRSHTHEYHLPVVDYTSL
jgi:hypothetical protein